MSFWFLELTLTKLTSMTFHHCTFINTFTFRASLPIVRTLIVLFTAFLRAIISKTILVFFTIERNFMAWFIKIIDNTWIFASLTFSWITNSLPILFNTTILRIRSLDIRFTRARCLIRSDSWAYSSIKLWTSWTYLNNRDTFIFITICSFRTDSSITTDFIWLGYTVTMNAKRPSFTFFILTCIHTFTFPAFLILSTISIEFASFLWGYAFSKLTKISILTCNVSTFIRRNTLSISTSKTFPTRLDTILYIKLLNSTLTRYAFLSSLTVILTLALIIREISISLYLSWIITQVYHIWLLIIILEIIQIKLILFNNKLIDLIICTLYPYPRWLICFFFLFSFI